MEAFDESDKLRDFFNVISVTADRDGVFYASTIEAKKVRAAHLAGAGQARQGLPQVLRQATAV